MLKTATLYEDRGLDLKKWKVEINTSVRAPWLQTIPGSGRFPGEGNGNPLQSSWPGNVHGQGSLWAIVHRVTEG